MLSTDVKLPINEKALANILRKHGVVEAKLFGSYARGQQRPDSDLDIYIVCQPGMSLFDVFDLQAELEKQTRVKIDLVTQINPNFAEYIEPDLIDIKL
jgi:predicted nucleotidyltransferase